MSISVDHYDLTGKHAIVLGDETPPGRAICEAFGEAGADCVGQPTLPSSEIAARVTECTRRSGGLDVLVSCSDRFLARPMNETTDQDLADVMESNFLVHYAAVRAGIEHMAGRGNIIVLSHVLGERGLPNTTAYGAAHGATQNLIRGAAQEVGPRGISVNGIALGWMDWMADRIDPTDEEALRAVRFTIAKTPGTAADIAPLAVWLAGTAVGFVTGQTFVVDGGLTQHL